MELVRRRGGVEDHRLPQAACHLDVALTHGVWFKLGRVALALLRHVDRKRQVVQATLREFCKPAAVQQDVIGEPRGAQAARADVTQDLAEFGAVTQGRVAAGEICMLVFGPNCTGTSWVRRNSSYSGT